MRQVARFLDRTKKSLDYVNEQNAIRSKGSSARKNRSQSVYIEEKSPNSSAVTSPIANSRFTRAKSVTQIPTNSTSGIRDFTWSVLRKNDTANSTPEAKRVKAEKKPKEDVNKTHEVVQRRPSKEVETTEENADHVPTDKLSQEAFRYVYTIWCIIFAHYPINLVNY